MSRKPARSPGILRLGPGARPKPTSAAGGVAQHAQAAITLYIREIGQVPLLGVEEERALLARVRRGDERAREHLIKCNLRRVVEICREYEGISLTLLDLISEGNVGLMKAIERFEPCNGNDFAGFSRWWIKQAIKRALAK